jgi:hypothetical protein
MRTVSFVIAALALAATLAGCGNGDANRKNVADDSHGDNAACAALQAEIDKTGDGDKVSSAFYADLADDAGTEALRNDLVAFSEGGDEAMSAGFGILALCGEAGVPIAWSTEDESDENEVAVPDCPETAGDTFTYDDVLAMHRDGCNQSDGSRAAVVYGGTCTDGRAFAYKNLIDIEGTEPINGDDPYAYVVVGKEGTGEVKVTTDDSSSDSELFRLQKDCND